MERNDVEPPMGGVTSARGAPSRRWRRNLDVALIIARGVVLEAVRGRLPVLLLLVLVSGFALAEFVGAVAITESRAIANGALGAWLRLGCAFVIALFVVTSMVRDWADKGMELVLSLPVARGSYVLGRLAGYSACALAAALACALVLWIRLPFGVVCIWSVSLAVELLLVSSVALLCVLTLSQVPLAMSALAGFYLLSRSMAAIQLIADNPLLGAGGATQSAVSAVLTGIGWLLPDLHRFAPAEWLMNAEASAADLTPVLAQGAAYLALALAAALFDMERKAL